MSITILSITIYSLLAMMSNESFEMTHCELFAILSKLIKCDSGYPSIVDPSIGENGSAWRKRCRVAKTVLCGENGTAWRKRVCVAKTWVAWRKRDCVAKTVASWRSRYCVAKKVASWRKKSVAKRHTPKAIVAF